MTLAAEVLRRHEAVRRCVQAQANDLAADVDGEVTSLDIEGHQAWATISVPRRNEDVFVTLHVSRVAERIERGCR